MALFKNRGQNLNRANSIIQGMQAEEETVVETPAEGVVETPQEQVIEETVTQEVVAEEHIETPTVVEETPVEGAPQETPPAIEQPEVEIPVQATEISDDLILSKLSETLGREIKSFDDLKPVEVEIDPEVKQLLDWKEQTGLSLSKWNDFNKDFSKMGDLDVAKEILAQDYPNFTKEELEYSLKDYIYDENMDDDSDKMRKSIELKKIATKGRKELEKNKLNFIESQAQNSLTSEQSELINYANSVKANESQAQAAQQDYNNKLNQAALNLNTLNLNLEEGVTIEHKVLEQDQKSLSKHITEMPHWYNKDGSFNHSNIVSDGYKIKNFDSLISAAYEQGKSVATEGSIKDKNNINLNVPSQPQGVVDEEKGNIKEVVSNLTGRRGSNFRFRTQKQE